jgi:predicted GNAT family acetyltransferase
MKKITGILCILLIGISNWAFAEKFEVVSKKNEFGGVTAIITYSPDDRFYKNGIVKLIGYLDGRNKMVKLENIYADEFVRRHLKTKTIEHYAGNEENIVKSEEFYTDQFSRLFGFSRQTTDYDVGGNTVKVEKFYTGDWTRKKGISRKITYYDRRGNQLRIENYDQKGHLMRNIQ